MTHPLHPSRSAIDILIDAAPVFSRFEDIVHLNAYLPLPDDWVLAVADVVDSTAAIMANRYKAVNMTGAAVIAAVRNELGAGDLPYVFSGDGAAIAAPASMTAQVTQALAQVQAWVASEFQLTLRVASIPIGDIRAAGKDVRLARYAPSGGVWYAVFSGGGLAWAEAEMKAGRYHVPARSDLGSPNLEGLSCRWNKIESKRGVILSIILSAPGGQVTPRFLSAVKAVIDLADRIERGAHPLPLEGPAVHFRSQGISLEARIGRGSKPTWRYWISLQLLTIFTWAVFKFNWRVGGFDPAYYRQMISQNADFQKYDDGLKMTLDCPPDIADDIEAMLEAASARGDLHYGTFRQNEALMTCLVPSIHDDGHFHFIDGADGGYASAAAKMKARFL